MRSSVETKGVYLNIATMKIISLLFVFLFTVVCHGQNPDLLDTLYEWKYIEYEWESDDQKQNAIGSGDYNMSASVPIDVDIFGKFIN